MSGIWYLFQVFLDYWSHRIHHTRCASLLVHCAALPIECPWANDVSRAVRLAEKKPSRAAFGVVKSSFFGAPKRGVTGGGCLAGGLTCKDKIHGLPDLFLCGLRPRSSLDQSGAFTNFKRMVFRVNRVNWVRCTLELRYEHWNYIRGVDLFLDYLSRW